MAGHKISRASQDIKRELSVLLRELKDPRIAKMLSIVKVSLSNDMSYCTVYVSAVEGMEQSEQSVEGLKSAQSFIRRELANRLHLRKSPQLEFIADDSIQHGAHIHNLIKQLNKDEDHKDEDHKDRTIEP